MINYLYVHINNDYSGSTYAMKAIINAHDLRSFYLITDFKSDGFLKSNDYKKKISVPYTFKGKGIKTIFQILRYSFLSSFKILFSANLFKTDVVYVNTILPWTAALIGWVFKKKVIYHVHEYYENPSMLVKFYLWIMTRTADELIFVSDFTKEKYLLKYPKIHNIKSCVRFTPVRFETLNLEDLNTTLKFNGSIILICSPKKYKGVEVFVKLAETFANKSFELYLSGDYFFKSELPINLKVFIKHRDIKSSLRKASICVNLSQKPDWIETFGLTVWEALTQGTPVIVPNIGGVLEIIDETCGISCDTRNLDDIIEAVKKIIGDQAIYSDYSKSAVKRSIILNSLNKIKKL